MIDKSLENNHSTKKSYRRIISDSTNAFPATTTTRENRLKNKYLHNEKSVHDPKEL